MAEKQQLADDILAGDDEVNLTELSDEALGEIFGIDLDTEDDTFAAPKVPKKKAAKPRPSTRPKGKSSPKQLGAPAGAPQEGHHRRAWGTSLERVGKSLPCQIVRNVRCDNAWHECHRV